jgi:hypothetical protein
MGAFCAGKVQILPGDFDKIKHHMKANPLKAELVPFIPDVLQRGVHLGRIETPNHKRYPAFHYQFREIVTPGKRIKVIVDIGEVGEGLYVYSLNHEGGPTWAGKLKRLREAMERGELTGGGEIKIPGFNDSFEKGVKAPWGRLLPGIFRFTLNQAGKEVNLFILEVTDIATGRRLPEYEDVEAA